VTTSASSRIWQTGIVLVRAAAYAVFLCAAVICSAGSVLRHVQWLNVAGNVVTGVGIGLFALTAILLSALAARRHTLSSALRRAIGYWWRDDGGSVRWTVLAMLSGSVVVTVVGLLRAPSRSSVHASDSGYVLQDSDGSHVISESAYELYHVAQAYWEPLGSIMLITSYLILVTYGLSYLFRHSARFDPHGRWGTGGGTEPTW
jgi:hypothetical protein